MELKTNTQLKKGNYTIISVLGQGGFGITYKAITHGAVSGVLGGVKVDIPVAVKEFFMKDSCVRNEQTSCIPIPTKGGKEQIERYETLPDLPAPELWINPEVKDFFKIDNSKDIKDIKVINYQHHGKISFPIAQ